MDDTIDEMHTTSRAIEMFEVQKFDPQMQEIAAIVLEASHLIAEAAPLLRNVERNGQRLHEMTGQIIHLEEKVDGLHEAGMKALFQAQKQTADPLAFMVSREVYKHLERIADAFEDVANEINSLVIDHA
jgi:uncharacterized protein